MIEIDANGSAFNPLMARQVVNRLMRENLEVESVAMHPEQLAAVLNCYVSVTIAHVDGAEELSLDKLPPMTLMGRPIAQSDSIPPNMIKFKDSKGQEIAALINLGRIQ